MKIRLSIRNKVAIAIFSVVLFIVIIVFLHQYFIEAYRVKKEWNAYASSILDETEKDILIELSGVCNDLFILRDNVELRNMLDSISVKESQDFKEYTQKAFLSFSSIRKRYDQVRYIDESGRETVRINFDGQKAWIVPDKELQNKRERYYFKDTLNLNSGEVFISPLDLNIEKGEIEEPFKPVLRYGTPVFDSEGHKRGIVIVNYLADIFLELLRTRQETLKGSELLLLNKEGCFFVNPDVTKEWGFMFKNNETLQKIFPEIVPEIFIGNRGSIRTHGFEFKYKCVYPISGGEKYISSTGSPDALSPSQQYITLGDYYWILVFQTPLTTINASLIKLMMKVIVLTCIAISGGFIVSFWLSSRLTRPIAELRRTVENINFDREPIDKANVSSRDETGDLANAFNKMIHTLEISRNELVSAKDYTDNILESMIDPLIVIDFEGIIKTVNRATLDLLEYREEEIVGKPVSVIFKLKEERISKKTRAQELTKEGHIRDFKTKSGEKIPVSLFTPIMQNRDGRLLGYVCVARDMRQINKFINDLEKARSELEELSGTLERKVEERTEELCIEINERKKVENQMMASLKEKEVLLKEVHHRVKNNLQVVSSLLSLQSRRIENKQSLDILKDSQNRVRSIALIHEKLYQSRDMANVNFAEYVKTLANRLYSSYGIDLNKIALKVNVEDVSLGIDKAVPCGLIINELISNSLKHAFPEGKDGEMNITLRRILDFGLQNADLKSEIIAKADGRDLRQGGQTKSLAQTAGQAEMIELLVSDNGVGLPEGLDFRTTKSLGLNIITILVEDQLHGKIELDRMGKGTGFKITFNGGLR